MPNSALQWQWLRGYIIRQTFHSQSHARIHCYDVWSVTHQLAGANINHNRTTRFWALFWVYFSFPATLPCSNSKTPILTHYIEVKWQQQKNNWKIHYTEVKVSTKTGKQEPILTVDTWDKPGILKRQKLSKKYTNQQLVVKEEHKSDTDNIFCIKQWHLQIESQEIWPAISVLIFFSRLEKLNTYIFQWSQFM